MPLDLSRTFRPVQLAVLTVSDTRTLADDTSGGTLVALAEAAGHVVTQRELCVDDADRIVAQLQGWLGRDDVEVVIITGGTGVTARDVTPEAVRRIADKEIPGFGELFRWLSFQSVGTSTIQSRALAVVAQRKLVFALPGSTGAVKDAWMGILVHQLDIRHRPCNFVELLPRM